MPGDRSAWSYNEGMDSSPESPDLINLYALVTYLPNPLGAYLNSLRRELVPNCHLRAHVTVLPPRRLISGAAGWGRLQRETLDFSPIEIELGDIEVFPITSVIYLSIHRGMKELVELHDHLAKDELAFDEPYQYHPHITLAQGLAGEPLAAAVDHAKKRWRAYKSSRKFVLDSMTFVQSTAQSEWLDLGEVPLGVIDEPASRTLSSGLRSVPSYAAALPRR